MTKKKITRKEFIAKTGKCAGGLVCTPVVLSIFQSCAGPTGPDEDICNSAYSVTCPAHNSVFNEDGEVLSGPASLSLVRYNVSLSDDKSKIIFNDESTTISLSEHPNLQNVGGTSHIDSIAIDPKGVLLYRKSESEVLVLSRTCPHESCGIDPFNLQAIGNGVEIISMCPCHFSEFNEEGEVLEGPAESPLTRYSASSSEESIIIAGANDYEINLSDHPDLENVGGVSFVNETPFNPKGLLMYRKSEEEVIVFSRVCPHAGEQTGSFEECS